MTLRTAGTCLGSPISGYTLPPLCNEIARLSSLSTGLFAHILTGSGFGEISRTAGTPQGKFRSASS